MSDDDEELDELTGAWALDAVDDEERAAIESRLGGDPDLRAEADELREIAGLLGEAASERPPPDLRAAILAEIDQTPQEPPLDRDRPAVDPPAVSPPGASETVEDAVVVPLRSRNRPRVVAALAAAAIVAIALVGVAVVGGGDDADQIAVVTDDPAAVVFVLSGELGEVQVVVSEAEDAAVVLADDVGVPAVGRTYQLWTVEADGAVSPSELFRPDDEGRLEVRLDGVDVGDGFAISEEPTGGSPQPTGDILAISA